MHNILIIGSGAREHIMARKISESRQQKSLFCWGTNNNPGIIPFCAEYHVGDLTDTTAIIQFARQHNITLAIIGPELPLKDGLADAFETADIPCVGPKRELAKIETSKGFARDLIEKYQIFGSPKYFRFSNPEGIKFVLEQLGEHYVVKADGLMSGKGVKVAGEHLHSHKEALAYCEEIFSKGQDVVIEEKMEGEEFSLLSLVSGTQCVHMPAIQDHKRAYNNDEGPNTGGMGTYSDSTHRLPFTSNAHIEAAKTITEQVVRALRTEYGDAYRGILYGSFMITVDGVKLIEYNARFGDPEVMNLLTLLETDFIDVCLAIMNSSLDTLPIHFANKATVCKYVVPEGYPDHPLVGQPITLGSLPAGVDVYYGAIDKQNNQLLMTGSRALAVIAQATTIPLASALVEQAIATIHGPVFHRSDIGTPALINKRVEHINSLCQEELALL